MTPSVGKCVHLLNVELRHDKGVLRTKVYHDPATNEYEVPDKFEYQTRARQPSKLLHAALLHAIRCCSTEAGFREEIRHLVLCHLLHGFSPDFVQECLVQFFTQFDATETRHGKVILLYDHLRQRVLDHHHQQQVAMEMQRQANRTSVRRIRYPKSWDAEAVAHFKATYMEMLKACLGGDSTMKEDDIKMVARPDSPLTMNDYLVDKKPPRRLLTLSKSETDQKHAY